MKEKYIVLRTSDMLSDFCSEDIEECINFILKNNYSAEDAELWKILEEEGCIFEYLEFIDFEDFKYYVK